jgi:hypothetical protein
MIRKGNENRHLTFMLQGMSFPLDSDLLQMRTSMPWISTQKSVRFAAQ